MRQLIKILVSIFMILILYLPSSASISGKIEYQIPIDYTKLSETELIEKANFYYNLALKNKSLNDEMTAALNLYTMLAHKNPQNIFYLTRLGTLYDILGQDKYAKGAFYDAIGIDSSQAEPYYRLGEFFYKRCEYKKALKMFKEAYKKGYTRHYDTAYKLGDIYAKLGDTEASLKYLKLAQELSPNSELDNKIIRIENANKINQEYYSDSRIRLIER